MASALRARWAVSRGRSCSTYWPGASWVEFSSVMPVYGKPPFVLLQYQHACGVRRPKHAGGRLNLGLSARTRGSTQRSPCPRCSARWPSGCASCPTRHSARSGVSWQTPTDTGGRSSRSSTWPSGGGGAQETDDKLPGAHNQGHTAPPLPLLDADFVPASILHGRTPRPWKGPSGKRDNR